MPRISCGRGHKQNKLSKTRHKRKNLRCRRSGKLRGKIVPIGGGEVDPDAPYPDGYLGEEFPVNTPDPDGEKVSTGNS